MSQLLKIKVGKAAIECRVRGSGESVVLLPGMGGDMTQLDTLSLALNEAGYRTVAINPRGVGGSLGLLEQITLHDLAMDVAGVITALDAAPAHLLGRAFGNRIARCLAADQPALVRSLILLAVGGLVDPEPEAQAALERGLRLDLPEMERLEALRSALFSPASTPDLKALWAIDPAVATAQMNASRATPLTEWWSGGSAPLLVVQGQDDRLAPPGNGRILAEKLGARVQLVEIPDAGHAFLFEQPTQVLAAIIAFLRDHSGGCMSCS